MYKPYKPYKVRNHRNHIKIDVDNNIFVYDMFTDKKKVFGTSNLQILLEKLKNL